MQLKSDHIKSKDKKWILQLHHHPIHYHKDEKAFEKRKNRSAWNKRIESKSAYLEKGSLHLTKVNSPPNFNQSDLILIRDFNSTETPRHFYPEEQSAQFFNIINRSAKFDIFELKLVEHKLVLHLQYDLYKIGQPKRDNFKLCELELDVPIEVNINGKLDHSLSAGRERTFIENHYILHLIGLTDTFQLHHSPLSPKTKHIPTPQKVINLMKSLY